MTRFEILGPLAVDGDTAAVTAGRDRTVLALLLLRAGRVVPLDDLVDAVWETDPPTTARTQLQSCVSRLRRALPGGALVTDPAGYLIRADDLDAAEFARLRRIARDLPPDQAVATYRAALALWRGPALPGIESRSIRVEAALLDETLLETTEQWAEASLALGDHASVTTRLTGLVERHPLREGLRALLMRALHAGGRRAEALRVYRDTHRVLADELGISPGAALETLHRQVLDGVVEVGPGARPRSLPRAVADFTGRVDVLRRLITEIEATPPTASLVQVIDGMGGSGKPNPEN